MDKSNNKEKRSNTFKPKKPKNGYQSWLVILVLAGFFVVFYLTQKPELTNISFTQLRQMLIDEEIQDLSIVNGKFVEVTLKPETLKKTKYTNLSETKFDPQGPHFKIKTPKEYFLEKLKNIEKELPEKKHISPSFEERKSFGSWFFSWGFFILLLIGFWWFLRRLTSAGGPSGQIFNIGKSRASLFDGEKVEITFKDVAGLDEAKEEVEEVVQFLKNPKRYTDLGGKIPKGVLLIGAPGTGKTLLAKAVAGESGVPFFSLSGSDFVEMFVGVGAARVRDLFKQAKEKAPCIVFIDEIDAIGRSRGRSQAPGGANDERENTLNSLLVEMDGFGTDSGVIILAASNRPDVLDSALTRAGRFDRQIGIDKPDLSQREAIFKVHIKPLKTYRDVKVKDLAAQTPGFAGADIANVCNEAALIAGRKNKKSVGKKDFEDAIDRVIGGLEKKSKIISVDEKRIVAYHEAGHAVVGWFLPFTDPLVKVSIVPRGIAALGYAQYLPQERFLRTKEQMLDEMAMALGGRAAEEIIFNKISTGALSDLERITKMAYNMVTVYGMNEVMGNISYYDSQRSEYMMQKPYSEATAEVIDKEVKNLINLIYKKAKNLLMEKRSQLEVIAQELLKKEVISSNDIKKLIGERPFQKEQGKITNK